MLNEHYQILGLNPNRHRSQPYTLEEINDAFIAKAKLIYPNYPDRSSNDVGKNEQWEKLIRAKVIIVNERQIPKFVTNFFILNSSRLSLENLDFFIRFHDQDIKQSLQELLNVNDIPEAIVSYFEIYKQALKEWDYSDNNDAIKNSFRRFFLNVMQGGRGDFHWPLSQKDVEESSVCQFFLAEKLKLSDLVQLKKIHMEAFESPVNGLHLLYMDAVSSQNQLNLENVSRLKQFHLQELEKREKFYNLIHSGKLSFLDFSQMKEFHLEALKTINGTISGLYDNNKLPVLDLAQLQPFHLKELESTDNLIYKLFDEGKLKASELAQLKQIHLEELKKENGVVRELFVKDRLLAKDLARLQSFHLKELGSKDDFIYKLIFDEEILKASELARLKPIHIKKLKKENGVVRELFVKDRLSALDLTQLQSFHLNELEKNRKIKEFFLQDQIDQEFFAKFSNSEKHGFSFLEALYEEYNEHNEQQLAFDEIYFILQDKLAQAIYEKMLEQLDWSQRHRLLKNFDYFIKSEGYKYFTNEVLEPLDLEISRIRFENRKQMAKINEEILELRRAKSQNKENSLQKGRSQMSEEDRYVEALLEKQRELSKKSNVFRRQRNELCKKFINNACDIIMEEVTDEHVILENIRDQYSTISSRVAVFQRNPLGDLLKGILGTLLAIPCALIPLCFEAYTNIFFQTKSYAVCNHTYSDLQKKCDEHKKGNLSCFFQPSSEKDSVQKSSLESLPMITVKQG